MQAGHHGDGFCAGNILWPKEHFQDLIALSRHHYAQSGHGRPEQAVVGLGGQAFMRKNSQDAVRAFRPYFDNAPVYGHGPSLVDFMEITPLSVGSPQQVIEKTLRFREYFGVYQRQMFDMNHAGLPLKTVLDQLDMLGEVVQVLRKECANQRSAGVAEPPLHRPSRPADGSPRPATRRTGRPRGPAAGTSGAAVGSGRRRSGAHECRPKSRLRCLPGCRNLSPWHRPHRCAVRCGARCICAINPETQHLLERRFPGSG
ncbi:hypothetical protein Srubr_29600 [Streptomyces rubradiris]|uniref:Luciferase-like domain-containing protein n=1 Tax=Streptomyces rubradiris TaxID=285531 RepID=A0ABQ3RB78_STRRR|nr:hypothetical protein GCM10018792_52480 [Streptomyces rubradiris]GHI53114.1 hypothetical protein Srubr_29600 [Streptomyces rubradiris]